MQELAAYYPWFSQGLVEPIKDVRNRLATIARTQLTGSARSMCGTRTLYSERARECERARAYLIGAYAQGCQIAVRKKAKTMLLFGCGVFALVDMNCSQVCRLEGRQSDVRNKP